MLEVSEVRILKGFFFQAEDGIRDCLLSRGLGDVYKRQSIYCVIEIYVVYSAGRDVFYCFIGEKNLAISSLFLLSILICIFHS